MPTDRYNGAVVVCTERALCSEVKANGHALVADEPAALGGTNAGPTPYDYLLSALGSCTAITVRMYADRKGWPLESVTVRAEQGRIDRIELELKLEGPLDVGQRERLREIADKCPVKRTLGSEVLIETRAATK
jgi:putative redox protein